MAEKKLTRKRLAKEIMAHSGNGDYLLDQFLSGEISGADYIESNARLMEDKANEIRAYNEEPDSWPATQGKQR